MRRLWAAIAFLSRLPVPRRVTETPFSAAEVGRSALFFPLVGAGFGALSALVLKALTRPFWTGGDLWLPVPLSAILLVGIAAWITGALHLDGVADMADGFGGGHTRERVLDIMRDPRVGSFGAVALIFLLATKWFSLIALIENDRALPYLILAPVLGRWTSVILGFRLPYARAGGGLGSALTDHVGWYELGGATVLTATVTWALCRWSGMVYWIGVLLVTFAVGRKSLRRIGGVTGDILGANTELCEASVYVLGAVMAA